MTERTVKVKLLLEDASFRRQLPEDAAAVRGFDAEVKSLGKDAHATGVEIKSVGSEVKSTGEQIKSVTEKTEQLGDKTRQTSDKVKDLDTRLKEATATVRTLGQEFVRTGDVDVFKKLRSARGELAELQRIKRDVEQDAKAVAEQAAQQIVSTGATAGREFGGGFIKSAMSFFAATAPISIPVALVGAAALSTEIGAMAGGLTLGAVGLGGIAAGLISQFEDDRVKAAGRDLMSWLRQEFYAASHGLADPFINEIGYVKRDLAPIFLDLRADFDSLRPYLQAFIDGLVQAAQRFMPGFNRAVEAAGPLLHRLALDLPMLANAANIFFDEVSKGGKGMAEGLHMLLLGISALIVAFGFLLRGLADGFDWLLRRSDELSGALAEMADKLSVLSPAAAAVAEPLKALHEHLHGLATSADGLGLTADNLRGGLGGIADQGPKTSAAILEIKDRTDALGFSIYTNIALLGSWSAMMDKINGSAMAVEQANERLTLDIDNLTKSVENNGTSLDVATVKGAQNRAMLVGFVQDANAAADAAYNDAVAHGRQATAADEAKAAYDAYIAKIVAAAVAAGFNAQQVWVLINALGQVPKTPIVATVITRFLTEGDRPGAYRPGERIAYAHGGIQYAAEGLVSLGTANIYPSRDRPTFGFAEPGIGGEAFVPRFGDYQRSTAIIDEASRWYGGRFMPFAAAGRTTVVHEHRVVVEGTGLLDSLRTEIRLISGGDVQQALGGRP